MMNIKQFFNTNFGMILIMLLHRWPKLTMRTLNNIILLS